MQPVSACEYGCRIYHLDDNAQKTTDAPAHHCKTITNLKKGPAEMDATSKHKARAYGCACTHTMSMSREQPMLGGIICSASKGTQDLSPNTK